MLFKRKKKVNLDTQARIEKASGKLNEAFIMFQQAHDAVDEAQVELNSTIEESHKVINSTIAKLEREKAQLQKALDTVVANEGLKTRLKEFIIS